MLKLVWRPSARHDLRSIIAYIAERNLAAAASLGPAIEACAERLPDHCRARRMRLANHS